MRMPDSFRLFSPRASAAATCNTVSPALDKATEFVVIREKILNFKWPTSISFNLGLAVLIGFLYSLWVMGPQPLNPRNISWLTHDGAQHEIAWELFRQDSKLHWPLTFTDRIGYPEGESVSLLDPNPLIALLLKPFSRFLPEPFQYQGLEVTIICILQFFFALILFRVLFGTNALLVVLPALFFLIAPPLTWRFVGHYAMDHHWLLLASLLVFCVAHRERPISTIRFAGYAALLVGLAVAINPYLMLQVLLVFAAALVSLVWRRRMTIVRAGGIVALLGLTGWVVASAFGLIIQGGRGYDAGGYRTFSLNLLGLFDPQRYGSLLLPNIPPAFWQQYEGYNYLGLGVILLGLVSLPLLIRNRNEVSLLQRRILLPLLGSCLILTMLALSTKITFGPFILIDLDPHEKLTRYLGALRASGRLFWVPYYIILGGVLSATILCFRRSWAVALMCAAFALQVVDTSGLRHWVHSEVNNARAYPALLRSPIWSKLGEFYENLLIMPPWQCGMESPGGADGYRIFGFVAAAQHMRINSYFAARYTETKRQTQCGADVSALSHRALSPDSAYVVTFSLAQQIAQGPTGPGKCHNVDQFILCSPKADFGLTPLVNPGELLQNPLANSGFEDRILSAWSTWQNVTAVVTKVQSHSGTQSLAETNGTGSVYQDVVGLEPGHRYTVTAWMSSTPGATATAQIAVYDPGANVAIFSNALTPSQSWQLIADSITVQAPGILRIHLFRNKGSGTIFWDDVRIYREH